MSDIQTRLVNRTRGVDFPAALKIAHVFLSMPVGGAEDLAAALMRRMPADVRLVAVCLRSVGAVGEELVKAGHDVFPLSIAPSKRLNLAGIFRLSRWLQEHEIDVVHTQVYNAHVYGVLAAWRAGIPAVMHHQKTYQESKTHRLWMLRWLTRLASAQITLSEKTRRDICAVLWAKPANVTVIPNAVDTERFRPIHDRSSLRAQLNLERDEFLVGTVASLTAPKNHAANLDMWAAGRKQGMRGRFLLCGEGPLRNKLTSRRDTLGLAETFQFLGSQRPIHPWIQTLDLFVLCSSWEGQPLAILQAVACGVPVIASRIEGNVAVLGDQHPGLFDLEREGDYAARVLRFQREEEYRRAILHYQQHISPPVPAVDDCAEILADLYRRLSAQRVRNGHAAALPT